jgi:hypothetical protein
VPGSVSEGGGAGPRGPAGSVGQTGHVATERNTTPAGGRGRVAGWLDLRTLFGSVFVISVAGLLSNYSLSRGGIPVFVSPCLYRFFMISNRCGGGLVCPDVTD